MLGQRRMSFLLFFFLFLVLTTACAPIPTPTTTPTPTTFVYIVRGKFLFLDEKAEVFLRGCALPEGEAYYQPRPLIEGEIPSCYVRGIKIFGTYSQADIDAMLALMATVEKGEISHIVVTPEIGRQFEKGEITELPTNTAQVFYGQVSGSLYTLEKIEGVWQVVDEDYYIR